MQKIGIFTGEGDPHSSRVEDALRKRSLPFVRFDRADFPSSLSLHAYLDNEHSHWQVRARTASDGIYLEDLRSIWYRRPSASFSLHPELSPRDHAFAQAEARKGFDGLLRSLPCLWVSHPDALQSVEWKPRQLAVAHQCGFRIPKTLITNQPEKVLDFIDTCDGQIIYKPLCHGSLNKYDPSFICQPDEIATIYTTQITRKYVEQHAEQITYTATMFQEVIPKAYDLRVTVFGQRVFATEIHAKHVEHARIDWRKGYGDITYAIHQLPHSIEQVCIHMLALFGLAFSAIDMILTPDGEYVFIEQNGNGQWMWLEDETGQPMIDALIGLLSGTMIN